MAACHGTAHGRTGRRAQAHSHRRLPQRPAVLLWEATLVAMPFPQGQWAFVEVNPLDQATQRTSAVAAHAATKACKTPRHHGQACSCQSNGIAAWAAPAQAKASGARSCKNTASWPGPLLPKPPGACPAQSCQAVSCASALPQGTAHSGQLCFCGKRPWSRCPSHRGQGLLWETALPRFSAPAGRAGAAAGGTAA
jgi:hypothetical protein